jgi:hypothetical protein
VIGEVVDTLRSWDASRHTVVNQIPSALSDVLLVAGTPRLEEVAEQQVLTLAERYAKGARRSGLIKIYMELDRRGAELLFQELTEREEKNSVDGSERSRRPQYLLYCGVGRLRADRHCRTIDAEESMIGVSMMPGSNTMTTSTQVGASS